MVYIGKREYKLGRMIVSHMAAEVCEKIEVLIKKIS